MSISRKQTVGRRDAIYALGSVVAVGFLSQCGGGEASPASASTGAAGSSSAGSVSASNAPCVVTPALTEGPYFVDERLNRSDIRTDPTTGSARPGVPLDLSLVLSGISARPRSSRADLASAPTTRRPLQLKGSAGHKLSPRGGAVRCESCHWRTRGRGIA